MSKHTKLVQSKENKKNFFKFNILLKKRVSITKINIKNLTRKKDLTIHVGYCLLSFYIFLYQP